MTDFTNEFAPHYGRDWQKGKTKSAVGTMKNIFDTLLEIGHDEDFVPIVTEDFRPTDAPAGSPAKLEVLAERIRSGLPLWHPEDRADFAGLTGTVRPRDNS